MEMFYKQNGPDNKHIFADTQEAVLKSTWKSYCHPNNVSSQI